MKNSISPALVEDLSKNVAKITNKKYSLAEIKIK